MTKKLSWKPSYRIIRTIYPPVDLFEDISDPGDWELLASAESKLNPRIRDVTGNLSLVPADHRVSGPTASIVMGAFTHVSTSRPSRFSDGSFGVWYCGNRVEVALAETAHHFQRFMAATEEPPADADFSLLTCRLNGELETAPTDCLVHDDWAPGQILGRQVRSRGGDGILYESVRFPSGQAAAVFWPNYLTLPITIAQKYRYRWDGNQMTHYYPHGAAEWSVWPIIGAG